jgi:hypothetical protein
VPIDADWQGVVKVVGTFVHDPRFGEGHLNMYPSSITDVIWFSRAKQAAK